ncbi:hypothetical protein CERSUDRAFT_126585 [Gelatoporia subvermispora B]|uniref:Transmembrane protein n=1 Tax=Ceriporiopsis subvermispora (strain B) TaxID=914234 RepID=M2PB44_CERS8|nr:hypothetical protein CERSUDRAFT_126585 [Gelatoporia subvermispora B]
MHLLRVNMGTVILGCGAGRTINWLLVAVSLAMGFNGVIVACMDLAIVHQVFVIWRLWVVFGRRWMVAVPFVLLWLGDMCATIVIIVGTVSVSSGYSSSRFTTFATAALVLTVVINITVTSLIVYRIWATARKTQAYVVGRQRSSFVMRIIVESGLLYTATAVVFLGVTAAKSNVEYIVSGSFAQVTGIAFNLIIIRVSSQLAMGDNEAPSICPRTFTLQTVRTSRVDGVCPQCNVGHVQIHISQNTETDDDEVKNGQVIDL